MPELPTSPNGKAVNHTHHLPQAQTQSKNEEFFLIYQTLKLGTKSPEIESGQSKAGLLKPSAY
jgi:hypothetical protein